MQPVSAAHPRETDTDGSGAAGAERSWHAASVDEVLKFYETNLNGLRESEAVERRSRYGLNKLPEAKSRGAIVRFLLQFNNVLILVLLAASLITALLGHWIDTGVILLVVLANAVIGFVQEGKAEQALDAIRKLISAQASILREGHRLTVTAEELVPGDIVVLDAGDRVPADTRLVRLRNLRIDEALLTGESVPVDKNAKAVVTDAPVGDRSSMAFSGTLVVSGHGTGIVVGTGTNTELGRISEMLGSIETLTTPLIRTMNQFARQLAIAILLLSSLLFLFAAFIRSYPIVDAFMAAVALAVAAIPEGLPAVMTITLAIGVQRMASRNAIIRQLPAVETLGSVSIICADKTGTFTRNEMTVRSVIAGSKPFVVTGVGYEPRGSFLTGENEIDPMQEPLLVELIRAGLLCNDASLRQSDGDWIVDGDPMEGALVSLALKAGIDAELLRKQFPRTDEIPFDAEHRFMATLHHSHEHGAVAYVKGAPERIIAMCDRNGYTESGVFDRESLSVAIEALASEGQRVLAFAKKPMSSGAQNLNFDDVEHGSTLLGLVGLFDPPREEAIAAVEECKGAGIEVKMITGDHAATASAIGKQLGLEQYDRVTTGEQLENLDDKELIEVARSTRIFGRASPEHKLKIVQALQSIGAVVAMTGDGVNDAPALKRADVGIAMGRKGTEAAKEASEMVLADDNFASIVAAVREGRTVYDNLRKCITFLLPVNGGESSAILVAVLLGLTMPITPLQILWVNMVSSVALALTLAFEPAEPDLMRRSPRAADEPVLPMLLIWRIGLVSLLFVAGVFGMFAWAMERGLPVEEARTIAVNTLVVMEIFYLFSVRYLTLTSITWSGILGTRAVLLGITAVTAAQFAFTYAPFMQLLFATRPVGLLDGLAIIGLGIFLLLFLETEKAIRRHFIRVPRPTAKN
jgi:magnesium-transporting ATPase (P-type)